MKLLLPLLIGFIAALYVQYSQKEDFHKITEALQALQKERLSLKNDLVFLKKHEKQLTFLIKKGWLRPVSRLSGAKVLKEWGDALNTLSFTIEPESLQRMDDGYTFKVSRIIFKTESLTDNDIYDFISNISKNFPGILVLRKISIRRHEKLNALTLSALRQRKRPPFIVGEIICDWVTMQGHDHEK